MESRQGRELVVPYYEYICDEGHEFEVEQRITADPLTECTECGAPCRRQLCKSSFALKGGGWSGDGYAKKGN